MEKVIEYDDDIKTVTETSIDKQGRKVTTITRYRIIKKTERIKRSIIERQKWEKFGDPSNSTTFQGEEIKLNLSIPSNQITEVHSKDKKKVNLSIKCRRCGELGHWTTQCKMKKETNEIEPETKKNVYVPPHQRKDGQRFIRDKKTLRLSNLPCDSESRDIEDLVRSFGRTERVYLLKDRFTHLFKGIAFIDFYNDEDAERAKEELDGYLYGNLVISAEWATQRK